ncbi:MAG TPA: enoyl-CoA hydratase-related protein [Noviherbaspirillum sp.]|uniref:enoyl-CoA hydratase/isomerase family protein n=1 Tax=Noviherbaspirillum sp. TaxID=1926288 RepID=UPI002B487CE5|nr:enoyl-CoA hydratase-related protein [Noviherbaspirillum sp.]HJV84103.1 enoyl-CoA hydratase-related protein [Noviherbaspirillum sp.]
MANSTSSTAGSAANSPLLFWRDGAIAHIRFNRPAMLNAIDIPSANAFLDACRKLSVDQEVRVVVISGEGRAFIAGGDLAVMRNNPVEAVRALITPMHEGIMLLAGLAAPVIASVHGAVAGGGMGVALVSDVVIAAADTRFNLAYVNIGTSPDCSSSWVLPRLVGMRKAMEIALLGETLDAAEALRLGLINRVVPAVDLENETLRLARRLADGPPLAQARIKRLMRESLDRGLQEQLDAEAENFLACAGTSDFAEGVNAFFEKRPARYRGR